MTGRGIREEDLLHAYVDGELDTVARRRLLLEMESNSEVRRRICELQRIKEWVKYSYEDVVSPHSPPLPKDGLRLAGSSALKTLAPVLIVVMAFGAGWATQSTQNQEAGTLEFRTISADPQHVILHIGESDMQRFSMILDQAESILHQYHGDGTRVEVIANAGGLDLLQTSSSPQIERIRHMMDEYDNVRFIACSNGLNRLREHGQEPVLIDGVYAGISAGDHLIQRLQEGWTYLKM
jgi:intracellular sulfur oxidation DsrE/DsrF family protein